MEPVEPHDDKDEQKKRKKEVRDLLKSLKKKSLNDLTPKSSLIDLYESGKNNDQITDLFMQIWADSEPIDTFPCGENPDHTHKLYSVTVSINNFTVTLDSMEIEDLTEALIESLNKLRDTESHNDNT